MILSRKFYLRPVEIAARDLLGKKLIHIIDHQRVGGVIVETEAYSGEQDLASHARAGKTDRNQLMYSLGGYAYIYFTYGMHWMLNCVTGERNLPSAILIRSIFPTDGMEYIAAQRLTIRQAQWCNGPAKLTKSLSITGRLNGCDLCSPDSELFIEDGMPISDDQIQTTPRIGIDSTPEPWLNKPWRFITSISEI